MADESEGIDIKLSEEDSPADILRESEDISLFADDHGTGEASAVDADLKFDDDGVLQSTIGGQDQRPIQNLLQDKDSKIFVIEISPSMKKSVQEEGQSLFEYFGPVIAGGAASKAVLEDQGNNTISN